jgi:hypothetical protein
VLLFQNFLTFFSLFCFFSRSLLEFTWSSPSSSSRFLLCLRERPSECDCCVQARQRRPRKRKRKTREKETKCREERERKSIAVSHYHHRRSFACLAPTSLLNSIFLTANIRLIVNARTIFSRIYS